MSKRAQKSYMLPYEELGTSFKEYLRMIDIFGNNQGPRNIAQSFLAKDEFHKVGELILRAKEAGDELNNPLEAVILHPDPEPQHILERNGAPNSSGQTRKIKFIFAKPIT